MLGRDVLISYVQNIPWLSQKTEDFRREIIWDFFSLIWDFFAIFCQASRYRARFQASSGHSDSANRPGYEAGIFSVSPQSRSLSSASFKTFCLTPRAYLNTQKYGLFWSQKMPLYLSQLRKWIECCNYLLCNYILAFSVGWVKIRFGGTQNCKDSQ